MNIVSEKPLDEIDTEIDQILNNNNDLYEFALSPDHEFENTHTGTMQDRNSPSRLTVNILDSKDGQHLHVNVIKDALLTSEVK